MSERRTPNDAHSAVRGVRLGGEMPGLDEVSDELSAPLFGHADALAELHALHLMLFTGLSTLPFEHLGTQPTPTLHQIAADRAAIARFSLDLLDATQTHAAA